MRTFGGSYWKKENPETKTERVLRRCFEGTKEQPRRLLKTAPSVENAESHLSKAEANLQAMNLMHSSRFFDWTIVTAYYSMYHAAMAALWLIGLEARTHECALQAFNAFYVQQSKVPEEYADYLGKAKMLGSKYSDSLERARTERVRASYGVSEIKSPEAAEIAGRAKEFVNAMKKIIYGAKGVIIEDV